jgi:hypothetical protein
MRQKGFRTEEILSLVTVDRSQGREWDHVIFDAVNTDAEGSGLLGIYRPYTMEFLVLGL